MKARGVREAVARRVRRRQIHHQPGEIVHVGPGGARAGDRHALSRCPTLRPVMAASAPASLPSAREFPARVDSERSGHPLPRGRCFAHEMRRDRRSPPRSAHKRRASSTDAPAGKRAAPDVDDPDVGIDLTKLLSDDSRGVMAPSWKIGYGATPRGFSAERETARRSAPRRSVRLSRSA